MAGSPALELLARARAELGELAAAAAACAELERGGAAIGTPYLDGRAELCEAELLMARGGYQDARRACEDALDHFAEVAAPYDAARLDWGWRERSPLSDATVRRTAEAGRARRVRRARRHARGPARRGDSSSAGLHRAR